MRFAWSFRWSLTDDICSRNNASRWSQVRMASSISQTIIRKWNSADHFNLIHRRPAFYFGKPHFDKERMFVVWNQSSFKRRQTMDGSLQSSNVLSLSLIRLLGLSRKIPICVFKTLSSLSNFVFWRSSCSHERTQFQRHFLLLKPEAAASQ